MSETGVQVTLSMVDRCCCELQRAARKFNQMPGDAQENLRQVVGWVEGTVMPEAESELKGRSLCGKCSEARMALEKPPQGRFRTAVATMAGISMDVVRKLGQGVHRWKLWR